MYSYVYKGAGTMNWTQKKERLEIGMFWFPSWKNSIRQLESSNLENYT